MTTDKITTLNNRLKEVKEKFEELQKCGIDEEILTIYIMAKTKISRKGVISMLKAQEEFYHKLIKKEILKELK